MVVDDVNDPDCYVSEINNGKTEWHEFHPEAQAELIEGIWLEGELHNTTTKVGNGCFFDADNKSTYGKFVHNGIDYTEIANNAVVSIRNGRTPDWGFW